MCALCFWEEGDKHTLGFHLCLGPGVTEACRCQPSLTPMSPQVPGSQSPERLSCTLLPRPVLSLSINTSSGISPWQLLLLGRRLA